MNASQTQKSISYIIYGILIFSLIGIVKSIYAYIHLASTLMGGSPGIGILGWLISLGVIAGYVLYILGLTSFAKELDQVGNKAIGLVRLGVIFALVAALPIPLLSAILALVAFIVELIGYAQLRGSSSLNATGQAGANMLFWSMIAGLICGILAFIPFIGFIFGFLGGVATFVMLLVGWLKIKNSFTQSASM